MTASKRRAPKSKLYLKDNWLLIIFLFAYLLLSLLLFNPQLFTGGDNASYIILAESIVKGRGYRDIHLPEEPQHTKFPFGFPLLLSLPMLLFGPNFTMLKFFVLLTGICSIFFLHKIGETYLGSKVTLLMPLYLSLPLPILYNSRILSEVPFICVSLAALYFFVKGREHSAPFYVFSFVCATYAFFIRMSGITLVAAMVIFLLVKKEYKYLLVLLFFFGAVVIPWYIRSVGIPQEQSYIDQLIAKAPYQPMLGRAGISDYALRIWNNISFYGAKVIPKTVLPMVTSEIALLVAGLFLLAFVAVGFISRVRKYTVVELYFLFTLCQLLLWPDVWSSDRFLLPVVSILSLYFVVGICSISKKIRTPILPYVLIAVVVLLNAIVIGIKARDMLLIRGQFNAGHRYFGYREDWGNYFTIIETIKESVPKDKIIMARKPRFVYVVAGNKSFRYPFTEDREAIKASIQKSDYIIIDNFYQLGVTTEHYLMPALLDTPTEDYQLVYKTGEPVFALIKVKK